MADANELLQRARALEEARATMDRLEAENEVLRRKSGERRSVAVPPRAEPHHTSMAAYRSEDRLARLERDLEAAHAAIANLSIENAILQSRAASKPKGASPIGKVLVGLAIAGGGAAIWLETENFGLILMAGALLGLGWSIYTAIGTIQPDGTNPRRPPQWPGGPGV